MVCDVPLKVSCTPSLLLNVVVLRGGRSTQGHKKKCAIYIEWAQLEKSVHGGSHLNKVVNMKLKWGKIRKKFLNTNSVLD